jgi:NAD(P)H-nitrite reductase large subunit
VGETDPDDDEAEVLTVHKEDERVYKKLVLRGDRIVGAIFIGDIERAGIYTGLIRRRMDVSDYRDVLLSEEFGLLSLPAEYRKHVVSGMGMEV